MIYIRGLVFMSKNKTISFKVSENESKAYKDLKPKYKRIIKENLIESLEAGDYLKKQSLDMKFEIIKDKESEIEEINKEIEKFTFEINQLKAKKENKLKILSDLQYSYEYEVKKETEKVNHRFTIIKEIITIIDNNFKDYEKIFMAVSDVLIGMNIKDFNIFLMHFEKYLNENKEDKTVKHEKKDILTVFNRVLNDYDKPS